MRREAARLEPTRLIGDRAHKWCRRAAEQGLVGARFNLGGYVPSAAASSTRLFVRNAVVAVTGHVGRPEPKSLAIRDRRSAVVARWDGSVDAQERSNVKMSPRAPCIRPDRERSIAGWPLVGGAGDKIPERTGTRPWLTRESSEWALARSPGLLTQCRRDHSLKLGEVEGFSDERERTKLKRVPGCGRVGIPCHHDYPADRIDRADSLEELDPIRLARECNVEQNEIRGGSGSSPSYRPRRSMRPRPGIPRGGDGRLGCPPHQSCHRSRGFLRPEPSSYRPRPVCSYSRCWERFIGLCAAQN